MSPNLDLLRAYAVLVVLAAHVIQFFNGNRADVGLITHTHFGRWGVLVFFVHTSLVLMQSLERTNAGGLRLAAHFYTRRVFRLYPLCTVAIVAGLLLQIPPEPHVPFETIGVRDVLSNLALTTPLTQSPLVQMPLWSLPLELQMYLLLPLLFWCTRRPGGWFWVLALWVAAVQLARVMRPSMGPWLTLLPFIPCFLAGVIAYTWMPYVKKVFPAWMWPMYIGAIWLVYTMTPRRGWLACLLLGMGIPLFREIGSPLVNRMTQQVAKYSYGIYLVHMPLIWLAFVKLGDLASWQQWTVFCITLVLVPVALYHLIEARFIRYGSALANRWFLARPSRVDSSCSAVA